MGGPLTEFTVEHPEHGELVGRLTIEEADVGAQPLTQDELRVLREDVDAVDKERLAEAERAGRSLRDIVERDGWRFSLTSPFGEHSEEISLEAFRDRDLDSAALRISWHFVPRWLYDRGRAEGRDPFAPRST